ncbi:MAG: HRDC domain-containing protein [Spirochaetes bacterium]|nr:HRDC domain-containing protein [Spirochaetota bacterium]
MKIKMEVNDMQVRLYSIRVFEGEDELEEMNKFLRGQKILEVKQELINNGSNSHWCFVVKYNEKAKRGGSSKEKVDYKNILEEEKFKVFSDLREIRKEIAKEDAVPAFAVFTDEELSKIAVLEEINVKSIQTVEGVGEKKVEKYGEKLIELYNDKVKVEAEQK